MIFDGINGYVKGSLNQANGTVLALVRGPKKGRNWFITDNPSYGITITPGAAGKVKLQGTNDVVYSSNDDSPRPISRDFNPSPSASWADIQVATAVSATGTFSVEYEFIQLVVDTLGTGTVLNAWINWK